MQHFCCIRYGRVSWLYRAATTYYLCCGQALEDSQGAGRIGLTRLQRYDFFLNYQKKSFQIAI